MADEVKVEGKTCEDCKRYLLCKKVKDLDNLPKLCKKFVDNFPEIEEIEDDTDIPDEDEDEGESIKYLCTGASAKCKGCPHATPHDPFDEEEYLDGTCIEQYEECEDVGAGVKCIPV